MKFHITNDFTGADTIIEASGEEEVIDTLFHARLELGMSEEEAEQCGLDDCIVEV